MYVMDSNDGRSGRLAVAGASSWFVSDRLWLFRAERESFLERRSAVVIGCDAGWPTVEDMLKIESKPGSVLATRICSFSPNYQLCSALCMTAFCSFPSTTPPKKATLTSEVVQAMT